MSLPTLYKLNSRGQLQQWRIWVDDDRYYTEEGLVGGKLTRTEPTTCVGKNVGRANATTPAQQATLEARAKWQKKLDRGYVEDAAAADGSMPYIAPMLAPTELYPEIGAPLTFPVYCQPKLDGVRCVAKADGLWSRTGEKIVSCAHIESALAPLFARYPGLILDGELYNHLLKNRFQDLVSCVRKQHVTLERAQEIAALIQYHVYDCISQADQPFSRRSEYLHTIVGDSPVVHLVPTQRVAAAGALDALFHAWLDAGYEGQMIRLDAPYEFGKRSKRLLKRKQLDDNEFVLADVLHGRGNSTNLAAKFVVTLPPQGAFPERTCEINLRGTHEHYREWLANKHAYIGRLVTVTHQGWTDEGKLRCGRLKAFRDSGL